MSQLCGDEDWGRKQAVISEWLLESDTFYIRCEVSEVLMRAVLVGVYHSWIRHFDEPAVSNMTDFFGPCFWLMISGHYHK